MSQIKIVDLEVLYHVGVPDEERDTTQRLLLTVEMEQDFTRAAAEDDLGSTVDYYAVSQDLLRFGESRSWKLIEKLAVDISEHVLQKFHPESVSVEVKKFVIPQARWVSVRYRQSRG